MLETQVSESLILKEEKEKLNAELTDLQTKHAKLQEENVRKNLFIFIHFIRKRMPLQ